MAAGARASGAEPSGGPIVHLRSIVVEVGSAETEQTPVTPMTNDGMLAAPAAPSPTPRRLAVIAGAVLSLFVFTPWGMATYEGFGESEFRLVQAWDSDGLPVGFALLLIAVLAGIGLAVATASTGLAPLAALTAGVGLLIAILASLNILKIADMNQDMSGLSFGDVNLIPGPGLILPLFGGLLLIGGGLRNLLRGTTPGTAAMPGTTPSYVPAAPHATQPVASVPQPVASVQPPVQQGVQPVAEAFASTAATPAAASPAAPGGWHPDPAGRHELRYYDGSAWTSHVSNQGVAGVDPI